MANSLSGGLGSLECLPGYVGVGVCASGAVPACQGGVYGQLTCCRDTVYKDKGKCIDLYDNIIIWLQIKLMAIALW
jgi:hypothetical protein